MITLRDSAVNSRALPYYNRIMYSPKMGQEIARRRETLRISQAQLAAKLETLGLTINQQRISDLEVGRARVPADLLAYLAVALHCTPHDLLQWDEFRNRYR